MKGKEKLHDRILLLHPHGLYNLLKISIKSILSVLYSG